MKAARSPSMEAFFFFAERGTLFASSLSARRSRPSRAGHRRRVCLEILSTTRRSSVLHLAEGRDSPYRCKQKIKGRHSKSDEEWGAGGSGKERERGTCTAELFPQNIREKRNLGGHSLLFKPRSFCIRVANKLDKRSKFFPCTP